MTVTLFSSPKGLLIVSRLGNDVVVDVVVDDDDDDDDDVVCTTIGVSSITNDAEQ